MHLSSSSIFSCITHGYQYGILISNEEIFSIDDIEALNEDVFEDLRFVYFGACETGAGSNNEVNLVNTIYGKGVDAVLGFTIKVAVNETNIWTETFMSAIADGHTISEALSIADDEVRRMRLYDEELFYTTRVQFRYFIGSGNTILCP